MTEDQMLAAYRHADPPTDADLVIATATRRASDSLSGFGAFLMLCAALYVLAQLVTP
jgi:hypothetical protein